MAAGGDTGGGDAGAGDHDRVLSDRDRRGRLAAGALAQPWRHARALGEEQQAFFGSFHQVLPEQFKMVQTWGWDGMPDAVSLETYTFTELPGGRTLMTTVSLVESMEAQAGMLASGMEVGINEGYLKLDALLARSGT